MCLLQLTTGILELLQGQTWAGGSCRNKCITSLNPDPGNLFFDGGFDFCFIQHISWEGSFWSNHLYWQFEFAWLKGCEPNTKEWIFKEEFQHNISCINVPVYFLKWYMNMNYDMNYIMRVLTSLHLWHSGDSVLCSSLLSFKARQLERNNTHIINNTTWHSIQHNTLFWLL